MLELKVSVQSFEGEGRIESFDLLTIVRQSAGKSVQRKYLSSTNIATNTGYMLAQIRLHELNSKLIAIFRIFSN